MAQRRLHDRVPPEAARPAVTIGIGWLAALKQRGATANDNRPPPWTARLATTALLALALALIYASVRWLP
ncbi:MAG: hypothetical protein L6R19_28025 [Alphaproteobacteria bacterium]|nr:hypothetical protein [Alphaproteobacteria bacterium]